MITGVQHTIIDDYKNICSKNDTAESCTSPGVPLKLIHAGDDFATGAEITGVIDNCAACGQCRGPRFYERHHRCRRMRRKILDMEVIPHWCPLEDAESRRPVVPTDDMTGEIPVFYGRYNNTKRPPLFFVAAGSPHGKLYDIFINSKPLTEFNISEELFIHDDTD